MLDRERQLLDLQEVRIAEQAIEIDTDCMGRQLAVQPRAQVASGFSFGVNGCRFLWYPGVSEPNSSGSGR